MAYFVSSKNPFELKGADKTPYLFRPIPYRGNLEIDKLVGGTVAWNQLVQNGNFASTSGWIASNCSLSVNNNEATVIADGSFAQIYTALKCVLGHKYLMTMDVKASIANKNIRFYQSNTDYGIDKSFQTTLEYSSCSTILNIGKTGTPYFGLLSSNSTADMTFNFKNVFVIDLTLLLGTTIADYIYSLESGTAGAGVAFFRKLFPDSYYAYNAGELMSVKTSAHVMTGFNQFDKSTATDGKLVNNTGAIIDSAWGTVSDYIQVLPNTTYYLKDVIGKNSWFTTACYDANKNFIQNVNVNGSGTVSGTITIPSNGHYIRVNIQTTNKDACCINLSWDGERDGEYEPYVKHSYALDSDVELRGLSKLDASNNLYCDGDTYESDGTVTRNYEYRAYASGDESLPDTITDGTHTVTKLTTPTTETADTFTNPQIVDDWGTEEYVDSRAVKIPVGHESKYYKVDFPS